MTESDFHRKQPFRVPARGLGHYKALHSELTKAQPKPTVIPPRKKIFDIHLTGYESEGIMTENTTIDPSTLLEMVYKPTQVGRLLRPAEIQLILAYMSEILAEAQVEEKVIIEEQRNAKKEETNPCK